MATYAEFINNQKKKKKNEGGSSFEEFSRAKLGSTAAGSSTSSANVTPPKTEDKKWYQEFFQKSKGNLLETVGGTVGDALLGVGQGILGVVEGVSDAAAYGVAGIADLVGAEDTAAYWKEVAGNNAVEQMTGGADDFLEDYSVLGKTSDSVFEGLGQVATMVLLGAAGGTAATTAAMGVSSMGSGMSEAYQGGATDEEALKYGVSKGAIDAVSEMIFGGLGKAANALGYSKGLSSIDDTLAKKLGNVLTKNMKKDGVKRAVGNIAEFLVKSGAEGAEEVIAGFATAFAKKFTYQSEDDINKLLKDESLFEQFVIGALTSGISQSGIVPGMRRGSLIDTTKKGQDFVTGLNANETAVIDKVYADEIAKREEGGKKVSKREQVKIYDQIVKDLERGDISTDTIESVLGGDDYKAYKDASDKVESLKKQKEELQKEFTELNKLKTGDRTGEQTDRLEELRSQIKELDQQISNPQSAEEIQKLKSQVSRKVSDLSKNDRLGESYRESSRRGEHYAADLSQYSEKQQHIVKGAVDSGILNNTRKAHELVDMLAKLYEDKGVDFDFLNNEKLKQSSYAVNGKFVNGYYDKKTGRIGINVDSKKYLNAVVGHEITHVLEGTEAYNALQKAMVDYAKKKGDYDRKLAEIKSLYDEKDVDSELTADLVGDYLFSDPDFVMNLHATDRNLFQKIWDEIKYLCKIATAGSKEARELERIKKAFEEAYREGGKPDGTLRSGSKYSLSEYTDHQRKNWESSKRIIIYNNNEQLSKFIKDSIDDKTMDKKMYFGAISSDMAGRIKADAGIDVENYNLSLGSYEIRKILKDHGNQKNEELRGQRAITEDDFSHIVEVVLNPTNIKLSDTTYEGKPALIFTGNYNGRMNVVAVVSDKRLDLFVQTIYVNTKKENLATPIGEQAPINTPEANSGTVFSNPIVPQNSEMSSGFEKNSSEDGVSHSLSNTDSRKQEQLFIIEETNSAPNVYNAWIRSVDDIKTLAETLEDSDWSDVDEFDPDLTRVDIERAIESGKITVYSSYPIKNGVFVSPSKMEAQSYSSDGRVYQKTVNVEDVAWIDPTQGQYAEVKVKYSLGNPFSLDNDRNIDYNVYTGTDEFVRNVPYDAREDFSRSLANKTADITDGETRTIYVRGYIFEADGYMHGTLIGKYNSKTKNLLKKRGTKYGRIDIDRRFAPIWSEAIQHADRGSSSDFGVPRRGGRSIADDSLFGDALGRFSSGDHERIRQNPETKEYVEQIVNDLREMLRLEAENTDYSLSSEDQFPMRVDGYGIASEDVRFRENAFDGFMEETEIAPEVDNVVMDAEDDEGATEKTSEVEYPIYTTEQKLNAKKRNLQTELDKNVQLRDQNGSYYDQKISEAQAKYDAMENKNTKAANDLARSIERMKRLKANRNAEFTKRINDLESRIEKTDDQLSKSHYIEDQLEKYKSDSAKRLDTEKQILADEFAARRSVLKNETANKGNYISSRAKELYNELNALKKGVRASKELGYLLDHGYSWNALKSSLLAVSGHPNDVTSGSVEESTIREMLNEEYDGKLYELDELDTEYNDKVAELEKQTEEKIKAYSIANQRRIKDKEYTDLAKERVGDTSTWVDKKLGFSYKINTLRRNLRDIVRDANGNHDYARADAIDDEYRGNYNRNEADLNKESNQIKKKYADLKINKAEDAYIQMLGEFRHNPDTTLTEDVVKAYYEKHKDKIDIDKVDKAIEMVRKTYDDLFERVNDRLREQGMKEIPYRKGYFPHFTEEKQGFLAKLLNWKVQNNEIPTSIAGITEQFKPNRSWQRFNKQRTTDITDYSFTKGLDTYVQGALDWIYHIEDIQKRRALENYIRYTRSDKGTQERIDAIKKNETYDAEEMQEQIDLVYKEAGNPLNNFVTDLRAGTNRLANKKSSMDRGMEEALNRKIYSVMTNVSNRFSANAVAGNFTSAISNFIPLTQILGEVPISKAARATAEVVRSYRVDDGVVDKSAFLTNRLNKAENLYKSNWDKIGDKLGVMFEGIDNFTSQVVWRSKYLDNISNGMSEMDAIKNADQYAANVLADRSRGNLPTLFDSKNPIIKLFTAFQLEVNNQYGYMFKDMPIDVGTKSKKNLVKGYFGMFLGAFLYNELASKLTGRYAAFDPIRILKDLFGDLFDDEEEEEPLENILNATAGFAKDAAEELPFVGGLLGGGRVPISSALPDWEQLWESLYEEKTSDKLKGVAKSLDGTFYYGVLPMAGGQFKKTVEGLKMFDEDLPITGSYTDSGKLRYPVEDTVGNRIKAGLFGQYANKNAMEYFDEGRTALTEKQTQELADLSIPIQEYWEYRDDLKKLSSVAEKKAYINSLDLADWQKSIMISNVSGSGTKTSGKTGGKTSGGTSSNFAEFDYAKNNPEEYALSKAISRNFSDYEKYMDDLNAITADDEETRKEKVVDYINNLDAEYGEKIVLYKSVFKSDNTYNTDIVNFLNRRLNLSYDDIKSILLTLDFVVDEEGNISWKE